MPAIRQLLAVVLAVAFAAAAFAQGDRRGPPDGRPMTPEEIKERLARSEEFLSRIDANRNGIIEPEEAQGPQRFIVERILGRAGIDPRFPLPISQIRERLAVAYQNGTAFGPPGGPPVGRPGAPGSPPPAVPPEIQTKIRELASSIIQQNDREKKGRLTRAEWPQGPWGTFDEANRQGGSVVSLEELVVHLTDLYRQNKLSLGGLSGPSGVSGFGSPAAVPPIPGFGAPLTSPQPTTAGSGPTAAVSQPSSPGQPDRRGPPVPSGAGQVALPPGIDAQIRELASLIIQKYDREKKGKLTREEWPLGRWGTFDEANRHRGDFVTVEELVIHLADLYRQGKLTSFTVDAARYYHAVSAQERLPKGLPDWFRAKDRDGDGQVSMAEFSSDWTDSKAAEFERYDANHDGIITPEECLQAEPVESNERRDRGEHRRR